MARGGVNALFTVQRVGLCVNNVKCVLIQWRSWRDFLLIRKSSGKRGKNPFSLLKRWWNWRSRKVEKRQWGCGKDLWGYELAAVFEYFISNVWADWCVLLRIDHPRQAQDPGVGSKGTYFGDLLGESLENRGGSFLLLPDRGFS